MNVEAMLWQDKRREHMLDKLKPFICFVKGACYGIGVIAIIMFWYMLICAFFSIKPI